MKLFFNGVAPIVGLFFSSSPTAVARLIITIIINAVYRKIWAWSYTHISVKVFKLTPTFTNFNFTTTIIMIASIILVITSLNHAIPCFIFYGVFHPVNTYSFNLDTATRGCMPRNKGVMTNDCFFTTRTFTNPITPISTAVAFFFNYQPIKMYTYNIPKFSHDRLNINIFKEDNQGGMRG